MNEQRSNKGIDRRSFLQTTAAAGAGLAFSPFFSSISSAAESNDDINVGLIGAGGGIPVAECRDEIPVLGIYGNDSLIDTPVVRAAGIGGKIAIPGTDDIEVELYPHLGVVEGQVGQGENYVLVIELAQKFVGRVRGGAGGDVG